MLAGMLGWRVRALVFTRHLAQRSDPRPLLNDAVTRLRRVRLISESGEDCGEMPARTALARARDAGRDLMQVSRGGEGPAVVRLVDYDAWHTARQKRAYEERKRRKETRKLDRREGLLKQVRLSPVIDVNDVAIKMRQAREFLAAGYRVRLYMQFRKGQGRLQENAKQALISAAEQLFEFGKVQGVSKGGIVADLFRTTEEEKEAQAEAEAMGVPMKRKPLEVLIFPLPRKEREQKEVKVAG